MTVKRITSTEFTQSERNSWKNLEVNLDSFSNRWEDIYAGEFEKKIAELSNRQLLDYLTHFKIKFDKEDDLKAKLLENRKVAVIVFCILEFSSKNPKILSEIFNIPIVRRKINHLEIIKKVFEQYKLDRLQDLFLFLLKRQTGKGRFQYQFRDPIVESEYKSIELFMPKLASFLKRKDKKHKLYHFRFGYKGKKGEWIFLMLKETNDKVYHAIPHNISMVRGMYIVITINLSNKNIEINCPSKDEAILIRNYCTKRLKNHYTFRREEKNYSPKTFFQKALTVSPVDKLKLVRAEFKDSTIAAGIDIKDPEQKYDIIAQLKILQKAKILKLKDFSEFKSMSFSYKGIVIKVQVVETNWGLHRLNFIDRRISSNDIDTFKSEFKKKFGVELDTWLKRDDLQLNKSIIISKILDKKIVPVNIITTEIEEIIVQLMQVNIISKYQHEAKRICENRTCMHTTWEKISCPRCGSNLRIDGDFIEIILDQKGIYNFIYKKILTLGDLKASRETIQILRKKFPVIELMDTFGNTITVYISQNAVPEEIMSYYESNGLPLLIILTHYKDAIFKSITERNFECFSLVDFYIATSDITSLSNKMKAFISDQKIKWKEKLLEKGFKSFTSARNKSLGYTPQNFETDIFNILHELFYVAYKLGGSFTGIKAPDGIASVRNYGKPLQKFCMSWDCKYSGTPKGYQLNELPKKHRHYIKVLQKNSKVKFYGGLKIHAIISQNMDMSKYEKFYIKLTNRFLWQGHVIFINENILLDLYLYYRDNSQAILSKPEIFYTALHRMFLKIHIKDSVPYPQITKSRFDKFIEETKQKYSKLHINLTFVRQDFA
jgi:hypothetical protein